ncbi:hypothetical protein ATANTOWER_013889 [Ataeniobius toweri]|uniref:Uncharacterized protein n=1 Tax=Ataeniobius toweri TaxID=208326 RepID=A0ABU7BJQ5_9TELE|nr:hypothetical protein [Ataeniobius toweri]
MSKCCRQLKLNASLKRKEKMVQSLRLSVFVMAALKAFEERVEEAEIFAGTAGSENDHSAWHVPVNTWVNPDKTEDWAKEADDTQLPFFWGVKFYQPGAEVQSSRATVLQLLDASAEFPP